MKELWLVVRHPIISIGLLRGILAEIKGLPIEKKLRRLDQMSMQLDAAQLANSDRAADEAIQALLDEEEKPK